jgi:hypothetical protein
VLIYYERKVLLAGDWFVLREKYCWLVADKPSEQGIQYNIYIYTLKCTRCILYSKCTDHAVATS